MDRVLLAVASFARGRESVDLVEEDDTRRAPRRFLKQDAKRTLRLAHVFAQRVRAFAREERNRVRAARRRADERAHGRGLPRARRAVK